MLLSLIEEPMATEATMPARLRAHMIKVRCAHLRTTVTNMIDGAFDASIALEKLGAGGLADVLDSVADQMLKAVADVERSADKLLAEGNKAA
jgi:hypothetical protein